jgi:hypothetical protein
MISTTPTAALPGFPADPILAEVTLRLRRTGYLALREIHCEVGERSIRLSGRVPSYFLRQVAQAVVSEIVDKHGIQNQIEVVTPTARPPYERVRPRRSEDLPQVPSYTAVVPPNHNSQL